MNVHDLNLRPPAALLLFAAIFTVLRPGPVFAQGAKPERTSARSSSAARNSNQAENGARPTASPEPKETGLTQRVNEITSLFGLPITNSMIVEPRDNQGQA
jgi:hypothetical protein